MKTKRMALLGAMVAVASLLAISQPAIAADPPCTGYDVEVLIDVKPCKDPNMLNVNVPGWLPVCIEVSEDTKVSEVALQDVEAGILWWSNEWQCLLAKFDSQAVLEALGPVHEGQVLTLILTGTMEAADESVVSICGHDDVTIFKRGGGS